MKKLFSIITLIAITMTANAQSEPKMILGIHGGMSLTKFTPMGISEFFMDEGDWEHSFNPGGHIGFSYEVAMNSRRKLYFETGLELLLLQGTSKCYDWISHGYYDEEWGLKRKVDYCGVQAIIPLMFNYKIKINDNWKICPRFGLQMEIGIKGKETIKKGDYDDRYDHYDLYSSDEGKYDMFHEGDWLPAGFSGRVGVNCQYKRLTFGADFVGRIFADNIGFNFNIGYNLWSK